MAFPPRFAAPISRMKPARSRLRFPYLLALSCLSLLSACAGPPPLEAKVRVIDNDPTLSFVNLVSADGMAVGSAVGQMARNGCCIRLPAKWREGITVNLEWKRCTPVHDPQTLVIRDTTCQSHQRAVQVPRYPALDFRLNIHLLPDDDAVIIASHRNHTDPDYSGPRLPEKDYLAELVRHEQRLRERQDRQRAWEHAVELKRAEASGRRGDRADESRHWQAY